MGCQLFLYHIKHRRDICREYDIARFLFDKWVKQAHAAHLMNPLIVSLSLKKGSVSQYIDYFPVNNGIQF